MRRDGQVLQLFHKLTKVPKGTIALIGKVDGFHPTRGKQRKEQKT